MVALEERLVHVDDTGQPQVAQAHLQELVDMRDLPDLQFAVELERAQEGVEVTGVGDARAAVSHQEP